MSGSNILKGTRVLDFGSVLAIPICGTYLASMGAEVIKCESNNRLDFTRNMYPADRIAGPNRGGLFQLANLNKKSCTLNMRTPRGLELTRKLIGTADVVMHNLSTSSIEKWGFQYENLKSIRQDLIVVSNSGFGRSGPEKDYLAYGRNLHASAGLASLIGYSHQMPGGISVQWSDAAAALAALTATLAALRHRSLTGEGQFIDVAMNETTLSMLPEAMMDYQMNGRTWKPRGNLHDYKAPHNCYPCRGDDAWVAIAISDDNQWEAFSRAIGNPDWTREERFGNTLSRWKNQQALDELVAQWTRQHTNSEATSILQAAGVPSSPVLSPQEVAEDPQLNWRGMFVDLAHPELGARKGMAMPWRTDSGNGGQYRYAPLVGEDNSYVFCDLLGLAESEYCELVEQKIIW